MKTALTLSGSIRKGSYNRLLQQHVGEKLSAAGVSVNAIDLGDFDMPIFNEDLEPDNVPEAAARLAELWRSHDIVFIASPEYNGGIPPLLVNTLAWLSRQKPSVFRHAVFGIGGVSSGKYGTCGASPNSSRAAWIAARTSVPGQEPIAVAVPGWDRRTGTGTSTDGSMDTVRAYGLVPIRRTEASNGDDEPTGAQHGQHGRYRRLMEV